MHENQIIDPRGCRDSGDAKLDATLAAADEDMLAAISNGLDLDTGLARIVQDLGGSSAARPSTRAPAYPEEDQGRPDAAISQNPFPPIRTRGTGAAPTDVAVLIRNVNALNKAVEDQFLRARQAADVAARSASAARQPAAAAEQAEVTYQAIQVKHPQRHARLPRQALLALATVALDGVACYFAAQVLGGSEDATLVWTALFLAVLAGAEIALSFYRDRSQRIWRALIGLTGAFILLLGILRFWFLAAIGAGGIAAAVAGAGLSMAATAAFLALGYRALRAAETPQAWRARRRARQARQAAQLAWAEAERDAAERDRLIDAYLEHVRRLALKVCPVERQQAVRSAVRQHLLGKLPLAEDEAWVDPARFEQSLYPSSSFSSGSGLGHGSGHSQLVGALLDPVAQ